MLATARILMFPFCMAIISCSAVNSFQYYKPSPFDKSLPSKRYSNGVAVDFGETCVFVVEAGSANVETVGVGVAGIPLIPVGSKESDSPQPLFHEFAIWLVPSVKSSSDSKDLYLNMSDVILVTEGGDEIQPSKAQVSLFETRWDDRPLGSIRSGRTEEIDQAVHEPQQIVSSHSESVVLRDWTRIVFYYDELPEGASPVELQVGGLEKDGTSFDAMRFSLEQAASKKNALPGQSMDGEWVGTSPAETCRTLQAGV